MGRLEDRSRRLAEELALLRNDVDRLSSRPDDAEPEALDLRAPVDGTGDWNDTARPGS